MANNLAPQHDTQTHQWSLKITADTQLSRIIIYENHFCQECRPFELIQKWIILNFYKEHPKTWKKKNCRILKCLIPECCEKHWLLNVNGTYCDVLNFNKCNDWVYRGTFLTDRVICSLWLVDTELLTTILASDWMKQNSWLLWLIY